MMCEFLVRIFCLLVFRKKGCFRNLVRGYMSSLKRLDTRKANGYDSQMWAGGEVLCAKRSVGPILVQTFTFVGN